MSSKSKDVSSNCSVCGKSNGKRCASCFSVYYCSRDCQKKDWKSHKKVCVGTKSQCTRCLETITDGSNCCVPHPEHLLEDQGSMFGGGERTLNLFCGACEQCFSKTKREGSTNWTYQPASSKWCFRGAHTTKPIPASDQRRIYNDVVSICGPDDVQQRIDDLDAESVRILTIKSSGYYDDESTPLLDRTFPNLEELQLIDVCFEKVVLNEEKTPKLSKLEIQNLGDECDIEVLCPTLRDFDMRYYHGSTEWVDDMLDKATRLQRFQSYKLGLDSIQFASLDLEEVHLHRSDILQFVSIWAPRLEYLRLQGCYSLEALQILDHHPQLSKELPGGFQPSRFAVETTNSCLGPSIERVLSSHPRIEWEGDMEDETAGVGGSPIEALFRNMHQFGGL